MKTIITLTAILLSLTACAQTFEERYERALLDTAIRYELIKPAFYNLQSAYDWKRKEADSLRMQITQLRMQYTVREKAYGKELETVRRKSRKRGRIEGGIIGALIGVAIP